MSSKFWFIVFIIAVFFGCIYYWAVNFSPKIVTPEDILMRKVDSLSVKIDSIKRANDSIRVIIDTTEVEIQHTYEKYIEIRTRISVQSVDSDCVFFSNYLSKDSQRFIDTINFATTEAY